MLCELSQLLHLKKNCGNKTCEMHFSNVQESDIQRLWLKYFNEKLMLKVQWLLAGGDECNRLLLVEER